MFILQIGEQSGVSYVDVKFKWGVVCVKFAHKNWHKKSIEDIKINFPKLLNCILKRSGIGCSEMPEKAGIGDFKQKTFFLYSSMRFWDSVSAQF